MVLLSPVLLFISLLLNQPGLILITDVASLSEQSCPHLHRHDTEDEEDKEAEKEDVTKHGKSVQKQHHEDPHARYPVNGPQGSENSYCPDGCQVDSSSRELPVIKYPGKLARHTLGKVAK